MNSIDDEEIIKLLKSKESRDTEKGAILFIKKFKNKAKIWLKTQAVKIDFEDIWQTSASLMILAIQNGKYQKRDGVEMYTYLHYIMRSTLVKEINRRGIMISIEKLDDFFEQNHNDFDPEI